MSVLKTQAGIACEENGILEISSVLYAFLTRFHALQIFVLRLLRSLKSSDVDAHLPELGMSVAAIMYSNEQKRTCAPTNITMLIIIIIPRIYKIINLTLDSSFREAGYFS